MKMDECKICKKPFKHRSYGHGKQQTYCSKICRHQGEYEIYVCKTCAKPYRRHKFSKLAQTRDYCSVECTPREPCPFCGKIVMGRRINKSFNARRFCSRSCTIRFYALHEGKANYVMRGFVATMRRLGGRLACERCGVDNPLMLVVHHRDRDHANYSEENLETICANCHALEHAETTRGKGKRLRDLETARAIFKSRNA